MRVLHVNKRYPPHVGGIERHLRELAQAQARLPGVTVDVVVVAEGPPGIDQDGPVRVRRVAEWGTVASNPVSLDVARVLAASAADREHDVWHFHYPFPTGELSLLWRRVLGRPCPVTVCGYHSDFVSQSSAKRALSAPYSLATRTFLDTVDAVIAASPQLAQHSRFLPRVSSKVHVIPYGIDPAPFRSTPEVEEAARGLRERYGSPVTLFVGRLVPYKGVEVLVRALPYVPGVLVVVGDGPLRRSLQALAHSLGVAERTHFVGPLGQEELNHHFHAADVMALPSITPNEAFGLVQLEAHACGVPVVSTDLPTGVPFANQHGETGLVVAPGDVAELAAALGLLLEDEGLRCEMGERARARLLARFTVERMTDQVLGLYRELLERR